MLKRKKILPTKLSNARLVSWNKVVPKSIFPIEKGSKAGVVLDRKGTPNLFIFDTFALLDMLSSIDEALVDQLTGDEYHSKKTNPAGWLIDELETKLPLDQAYLDSLKEAIVEAKKSGWIPVEHIERELHLL